MTYGEACVILNMQDRKIRKINGFRFEHNGYEYRTTYCGGFCPMARLDRRAVGKRNFKWFDSVDISRCRNIKEVMEQINDAVMAREV